MPEDANETKPHTVRLDDWAVILIGPSSFFNAPETMTLRLHGVVTGHRNHADGKRITTSRIVGRRGQRVVTGAGTLYELGTVTESYAALYPGARERLLGSLPEIASPELVSPK